VHPIAKPLLIALGGLFLLWAGAVLLANIYLQSGAVQERLRDAISRNAGMPAKIRQTYYTPWSGVTLSGIALLHTEAVGNPFLEAKSLKASVVFSDLLKGRITVRHIALESPALEIRQVAAGATPPPAAVPDDSPEALEGPLPAAELVQTELAPRATPAPVEKDPAAPRIVVEAFRVDHGRAVFFDSKGAKTLELEGVFVDAKPEGDQRFSGTYRIERGVVWNTLRPRAFAGRFEWDQGRLSLPDLGADLAEGRLTAQLEWQPDRTFAMAANLESVSLKTLATDAGLEAEGTRGQLFGRLVLGGTAGQPSSLVGSAEASLVEARMEPIELIRQLGELLRVNELRMLELKAAEAAFTIRDEKVLVDRLLLASENFMIDATGETAFTGALDLDARLHVNEKMRRDTRGLIGRNFQPSETEGYSHMPFSVSGSLARPKSDLLDKVVGLKIGQDVGGLLKNLLRMPQKQKAKPTPDPEESPEP
jgi:hypothetical protein